MSSLAAHGAHEDPADRDPRSLTTTALIAVVAGTLLVTAAGHLAGAAASSSPVWSFIQRLNSWNVSDGVQTMLIALCAIGVVAVCMRAAGRAEARQWWTVAALFAVLFVLKSTGAVWRVELLLRSLDRGTTFLGWAPSSLIVVTLGVVVCCALALFFSAWVRALSSQVRRRIVAGGVLFLAGAVGAEGLTEWLWSVVGSGHILYIAADILENALELTGLVIFFDGVMYQFGAFTAKPVAATGRPKEN
jgi:hypothetical protein